MDNFGNFDVCSQKVITKAHLLCKENGFEAVEPQHIFLALCELENRLVETCFGKSGQNIRSLLAEIKETMTGLRITMNPSPGFSAGTSHILRKAQNLATQMQDSKVEPRHLLSALLFAQGPTGTVMHRRQLDTLDTLNVFVKKHAEATEIPTPHAQAYSNEGLTTLLKYCTDLTKLAADGEIDNAIGREKEIKECIEALSRITKNNPVLVGEPGTGKTAIAEGLAHRIATGNIPENLMGTRIFSLDVTSLVAGTSLHGQVEERIKSILEELRAHKEIILFVDEVHLLIGAGSGSMNVANMLKPDLSRGLIRFMGATTTDEYTKYIETDPAFERRMLPIKVKEPTIEETILILKGIREKYERFHKLSISESAIEAAVKTSARYITNRRLPDKAIDVLDQAAAHAKCNTSGSPAALTEQDILQVIYEKTGIPTNTLSNNEQERLAHLEDHLHNTIIGQDLAVKAVSNAIRSNRLGLTDQNKPIASFLFLGTTGVGKTELCKAIAEYLFNDKESIVRIDMSEYQQEFSVTRLFGAPPGYVGYDAGGQLTEAVRLKPFSVVLFDEFEKAHPKVFQALLQILDDGRLTDGKGRLVDFKNTIIIMTSNFGAEILAHNISATSPTEEIENVTAQVMQQLKRMVTPEFLNRIDQIIPFLPLTKEEVHRIAHLQLSNLTDKFSANGISLRLDCKVADLVTEKGYQAEFGARPIKRVIKELITDTLSKALLDNAIDKNRCICATTEGERIVFNNI